MFPGDRLKIQWTEDKQHVGHVSLSYLQSHCYESDSLQAKREAVKLEKPVEVRLNKTSCSHHNGLQITG